MDIGFHISKAPTFLLTLKRFYADPLMANMPVQIFTGSPKSWNRKTYSSDDSDIVATKKYVQDNGLQVFAHSIYLTNLSKSPKEFSEKALPYIKQEMILGGMLGFSGVVIHCGKSLKISNAEATDNMYTNLLAIYSAIDVKCPLLLETSSGQGSEICFTYADFSKFYKRFTATERKYIKICVDTCHVFAAGNDPLKFITKWQNEHPDSLVLVHYNDSKLEFGEKKDRHALPGEGFIGKDKMAEIAKFCNKYKLPMVIE